MLPAPAATFRMPRFEVLLQGGMQFRLVVFDGQYEAGQTHLLCRRALLGVDLPR
jgi:hypothetical protein